MDEADIPATESDRLNDIVKARTAMLEERTKALEESELKYRSLVESAGDAIFLADVATGNLVDCNRKAEELVGRGKSEIVRMHQSQLHPSGKTEEYKRIFRNHIETGKAIVEDLVVVHKDGRHIPVDIRAAVFEIRNKSFVLGVFRDITERKKAELALKEIKERYDLASSVGKVGVWDWNPANGKLIWSDEVYRIMGLPAGEREPSFEMFISYIHPDDRKQFTDYVTDALNNKKPFNAEYRVIRQDGRERFCHAIGDVTYDESGKPVRMMGTFQDVTERTIAEREQKSLEAKLQHVQKLESLGVLAGGIAHDFNNMLTSILGNADLALMDLPPSSPARPYIESISTTSRKAADLTRQMLAYSGKGKFVISNVNLNNVIREMNHLLQVSALKNVMLKYELAEDLPVVKADVTQIDQLIMNLIINASEAIGEKSGVITIRTGVMDCDKAYFEEAWGVDHLPDGRYVTLEVTDTGAGMDKETVARIFEPFFTTKFAGRGLGMSAVQGIVRGHHGAIKVYSEPGKGTTFKILLPSINETLDTLQNGSESGVWIGHGHVLFIDDEEAVRDIGVKMLSKIGFTVTTAANGIEALNIYRERPRDFIFILLDLTMPQMGGEDCFRELRRINNTARIIMTSGYNEQEVTQRFAGKGLTGFLPKPFQVKNMKEVIKHIIED